MSKFWGSVGPKVIAQFQNFLNFLKHLKISTSTENIRLVSTLIPEKSDA